MPRNQNGVTQEMRLFWKFKVDLVVINSIMMKGRCIIIP